MKAREVGKGALRIIKIICEVRSTSAGLSRTREGLLAVFALYFGQWLETCSLSSRTLQ